MNRFGLLLTLWVVLGLAAGMPVEGRRAVRRARVDVVHPELEMEHAAGLHAAPVGSPLVATSHAVRPAGRPAAPSGRIVRERRAEPSSCLPADPAAVPVGSRAPPAIG